MFTTSVRNVDLHERLDAELFDPARYSLEKQVMSCKIQVTNLQSIVDPKAGITYGIVQPGVFVTPGTGVRMIRCVDIRNLSVSTQDVLWVSDDIARPYTRSSIRSRDVLIGIAGTLATVGLAPNDIEPANLNQSVARLRIVDETGRDPEWIVAFLASRFGQAILLRRSVGSVQQHLNLADLPSIPVAIPETRVRKYVGDKIRQAERLRTVGNQTINDARAIIELINDGQITCNDVEDDRFAWTTLVDRIASPHTQIDAKHDRVNPKLLGDRIDSWFYKPEFVRGDSQLQIIRESGITTPTLESFATVCYGFMPTEDYWSPTEGALFLRVTNIQDNLRLDLSKLEYVNPSLSKAARYRLQEDDIVCVQCGNSTGRIALISARCNDWVFPSFALRIRLKDKEWDAAYVAGYLASWLGQSQIQRTISITSVRPNTTKPAIEAVTVPKLPFRTQQLIGNQLRIAINCVEQSVPLCDAAKLLVEALIKRIVTEEELIDAQTRLEKGDDSADRAILSRLFEGGWDATETRPLFPDLDAYYQTLRMVEREQTEVAAK